MLSHVKNLVATATSPLPSTRTISTVRRPWLPLMVAACLAMPLLFQASAEAQGPQTLTVTSTVDDASPAACNNGSCATLRDAIAAASARGQSGDTIVFSSSIKLPAVISLTSGLPNVANSMVIQGPGANLLTVADGGPGGYPLFTIDSGGPSSGSPAIAVTIFGLTIANAKNSGVPGGGLNTRGYSGDVLTISDCAFTGNQAANGGGGIFIYSGTVRVINSTFYQNLATGGAGGAIDNSSLGVTNGLPASDLTVINSTFDMNQADLADPYGQGGAIFNDTASTLTVINSTVSGNSANVGGGIANQGTLAMVNTIVSGNTASTSSDLDGSITTDNGGNLMGTSGIALAALGYYGGPTETMPPLTGSPALNAGAYQAGVVPATDQRGAPRPQTAGQIDSGAVQISNEAAWVMEVSPNGGPVGGGTTVTITGTGLDNASAVLFGGNAASYTVNPGAGALSSITATSPAASAAGTVDVTVGNGSGTSATGSSDKFTYYEPISIAPAAGTIPGISYGQSFSQAFTVSGGSGAFSLMSSSVTLPAGMTLTPTGSASGTSWTLSGTPTQTGNFGFTLAAADATYATNTLSASYQFSVVVSLTASVSNPNLTYGQSGTIAITLVPPSGVTATPTGTVTYSIDGGASASAALTSGSGGFVADIPVPATLSAGNHTLSWSFGGDSNYSAIAVATETFTVNPAGLTIVLNSASLSSTYDGQPRPVSVTTTPADIAVTVTYNGSSTVPVNAGSYAVSVTSADSSYSGKAAGTLVISRATPVITWNPPNSILYGDALGAAQLDAAASIPGIASVPGTFTYNPAAGTVLSAGNYQLTATFTPTDSTNYNTPAQATANLTVTKAVLSLTANDAARVYGTANPVFTGKVSGEVNGDTFTESFTTTATVSSNAGIYAIVPSVTGANISDYSLSATNGTLTVTKAATTTTLQSSSTSTTTGQSLTLTAQVQPATSGSPTGQVSFYDGATLLANVGLTNGTASYSISSLAAGTHSFTATYAGDVNFTGSASGSALTVPVAALDFTLTPGATQSVTVSAGGSASYGFQITPTEGAYPAQVSFSASGLPAGASATFSPANVAANGGTANVTLTVQTASIMASTRAEHPGRSGGAPLALGLLLLPMLGLRRRKRGAMLVVAALAVLAGFGMLSGCGAPAGMQTKSPTNYSITVLATSGQTQHSFDVNLTVQ